MSFRNLKVRALMAPVEIVVAIRNVAEAKHAGHISGLLPTSTTNEMKEIDIRHDESSVTRGLGFGELANAFVDVCPAHIYAFAEIVEADEHAESVVMERDERSAFHFF